jgi:hypothetical protein
MVLPVIQMDLINSSFCWCSIPFFLLYFFINMFSDYSSISGDDSDDSNSDFSFGLSSVSDSESESDSGSESSVDSVSFGITKKTREEHIKKIRDFIQAMRYYFPKNLKRYIKPHKNICIELFRLKETFMKIKQKYKLNEPDIERRFHGDVYAGIAKAVSTMYDDDDEENEFDPRPQAVKDQEKREWERYFQEIENMYRIIQSFIHHQRWVYELMLQVKRWTKVQKKKTGGKAVKYLKEPSLKQINLYINDFFAQLQAYCNNKLQW